MKILLFLLFAIVISSPSQAQNKTNYSELSNQICDRMLELEDENVNYVTQVIYEEFLTPEVKGLNEIEQIELLDNVFLKLYNSCPSYTKLIGQVHAANPEDDTLYEVKPISNLTEMDCQKFKKHEKFHYSAVENKFVNVIFTEKLWQDFFHDQTTTVNEVDWLEDCGFKLTFIKSDNAERNNYIQPGDTFFYQIIDEIEDAYIMLVLHQDGTYTKAKLYKGAKK